MANTKKIATSVAAVATAAAVLLGGTFAWQSISQTALNEASDVVNPGGRLHDDFNGENKDVYVENFADEEIFARVRLGEYMEIVINKGTEGVERTVEVIGTRTLDDEGNIVSYNYDTFTNYTDEGAFEAAIDKDGTSWWTWTTGGETVYMPTFNLNKDSLQADVNGTYAGPDGIVGEVDGVDDKYKDYVEYTDGDTQDGYEIYDADTNSIDELTDMDVDVSKIISDEDKTDYSAYIKKVYVQGEDAHTARATDHPDAKLISMDDWLALSEEEQADTPYWVYDIDGWVYWSAPIPAGETTGLLLDGIELNEIMDDSWYYAIQVTGQFITADDMGSADAGTGFYDSEKGAPPTDNALALLAAIGVEVEASPVTNSITVTLSDSEDAEVLPVNDTFTLTAPATGSALYTINKTFTLADGTTVEPGSYHYSFGMWEESPTIAVTTDLDAGYAQVMKKTEDDTDTPLIYVDYAANGMTVYPTDEAYKVLFFASAAEEENASNFMAYMYTLVVNPAESTS